MMHPNSERLAGTKDIDVNPDLQKERANCPFDLDEITNILDGGKENTEKRRQFEKFFLSKINPGEDDLFMECLSSSERYVHDIRKSVLLAKAVMDMGEIEGARTVFGGGIGSTLLPDGNPMGLHYVMFIPTLMGQVVTIVSRE